MINLEHIDPAVFLIIWLVITSFIAFFAYGIDKSKARNGKYRTSEKTLLGLGIIGGAAGALIGMKVFHHKTHHKYFWVINFASLAVHIAVLSALIGY